MVMKKYYTISLLLFFSLITISNSFSQDTLVYTVAEKSPVYYTDQRAKDKIMFYAVKNEKVKIICRYGEYQVLFQNNRLGWMDKLAFNENRIMVASEELTVYSQPDFRKESTKKFNIGDTIFYKKIDEKKVFFYVKGVKVEGWIKIADFKPLNENKVSKYKDDISIYSYNRFLDKVKRLTFKELQIHIGLPTSINDEKNLKRAYYSDITIVKNSAHYNGIFLYYDTAGFVKDSLIGQGSIQWYENIPLAGIVRSISLGKVLNIGNWDIFQYIDSLADNNTFLSIVFLIFKFAVIFLFFAFPVYAGKYFYNWICKLQFLPNIVVKMLNFIAFFSVYYLYYLFMLLHIFYPMDIIFTIGMSISLVYSFKSNNIFTFNHKQIDRNRCAKCHKMHTLKVIKVETLKKVHTTETSSWNQYLGSDTKTASSGNASVTVKTNYYQAHSNTYSVTIFHLKDHIECTSCKNRITINREEKKYGHV